MTDTDLLEHLIDTIKSINTALVNLLIWNVIITLFIAYLLFQIHTS